jgi:hypothetical protein
VTGAYQAAIKLLGLHSQQKENAFDAGLRAHFAALGMH